jgi:hypothetical protein
MEIWEIYMETQIEAGPAKVEHRSIAGRGCSRTQQRGSVADAA